MRGVVYALLASLLFGVTTPVAKTLLADVNPITLAGLFYAGSGIGLWLYRTALRVSRALKLPNSSKVQTDPKSQTETAESPDAKPPGAEPPTKASNQRDWLWLAGAIASGGVAAPILLMIGLRDTQASSASLFLNLEGVFTALIAWFVFKENFDARVMTGMLLIVAGGIVLSFSGGALALSMGLLLIALACAGWAIDNNLTRNVASLDAARIASIKGLSAGFVNLSIASVAGAALPNAMACVEALVIGFLGYGVSLVLYVLALRHIGAARTGAYFALAPFVGSIISIAFLKEPLTMQLLGAAALMAVGIYLHLTEVHDHEHQHEELEHEHEHTHDEHHQHEHSSNDPPGEPHTHWHKHEKLIHKHPHFPDQHHQHKH